MKYNVTCILQNVYFREQQKGMLFYTFSKSIRNIVIKSNQEIFLKNKIIDQSHLQI